MNLTPKTPFSTPLSRSAKEIEGRIRNLAQGKRKRPALLLSLAILAVIALCGSLVAFVPQPAGPEGGSPAPSTRERDFTPWGDNEFLAASYEWRPIGPSRKDVLAECGFLDASPFYTFYDGENLQLELYYDPQTRTGCAFRYVRNEGESAGFYSLVFQPPEAGAEPYITDVWGNTDPYSVRPITGTDYAQADYILDYQEFILYNDDGKPALLEATGIMPDSPSQEERTSLFRFVFEYREDGSLFSKSYTHNYYFITTHSSASLLYDEAERLVYASSYITHGNLEYYYIYENDGPVPAYCLCLDHNTGSYQGELIHYTGMEEPLS